MGVTTYWRQNDFEEDLRNAEEAIKQKFGDEETASPGTDSSSINVQNPYDDAYDDALKRLTERESFSYSPEGDAMYRHYKDLYTDSAEKAMKDAMGQAAAMTGGYASSYAQSVGQQVYNDTMRGLDDVIPELYQLARSQYDDKTTDLENRYLYAKEAKEQWDAENAPVVAEPTRTLSEKLKLNELFSSLLAEENYEGMLMQLKTLPLTEEEVEYYYNMIPYEWLQAYTEGGDLDLIEGNAEAWIQDPDNAARWNEIVGKVLSDFSLESLTEEERRIYDMVAPLTEGLPV